MTSSRYFPNPNHSAFLPNNIGPGERVAFYMYTQNTTMAFMKNLAWFTLHISAEILLFYTDSRSLNFLFHDLSYC